MMWSLVDGKKMKKNAHHSSMEGSAVIIKKKHEIYAHAQNSHKKYM